MRGYCIEGPDSKFGSSPRRTRDLGGLVADLATISYAAAARMPLLRRGIMAAYNNHTSHDFYKPDTISAPAAVSVFRRGNLSCLRFLFRATSFFRGKLDAL